MKTKRLWKHFSELTECVKEDHIKFKKPNDVHDFLHAIMVAQYCSIISENPYFGELAFVAGICHNTDRLFGENNVETRVSYYLNYLTGLTDGQKKTVLEAVINHSKPNDPDDNPVTIILKDADRLAIIGPNSYIRVGQALSKCPAYNPRYIENQDPKASYQNPLNPLNAMKFWLEWETWLRVPKAKELAKPWFNMIRLFISGIKNQLIETDLFPYPFE
ncbi:MAG: hypothetical protein FJZ43_02775 [Candidatus Staskawiczbacteria bacterium]|nr:hypothetical protein [Candidatus Staskawiczbacteria bacterium]